MKSAESVVTFVPLCLSGDSLRAICVILRLRSEPALSLPKGRRLWLNFLEHFQTEPVGHAGDVIAYHSLQPTFRYEALKIAWHKLRPPAEACEKLPEPVFDFARRLYQ